MCLAGAKLTQEEVERALGVRAQEGWGELLAWVKVILVSVLAFLVGKMAVGLVL